MSEKTHPLLSGNFLLLTAHAADKNGMRPGGSFWIPARKIDAFHSESSAWLYGDPDWPRDRTVVLADGTRAWAVNESVADIADALNAWADNQRNAPPGVGPQ